MFLFECKFYNNQHVELISMQFKAHNRQDATNLLENLKEDYYVQTGIIVDFYKLNTLRQIS